MTMAAVAEDVLPLQGLVPLLVSELEGIQESRWMCLDMDMGSGAPKACADGIAALPLLFPVMLPWQNISKITDNAGLAKVVPRPLPKRAGEEPQTPQDGGMIARYALQLARDRHLSQVLCRALDEAADDEACRAMLWNCRGSVWDLMFRPGGSRVLGRYISRLRPSACQFIAQEILRHDVAGVHAAARDKSASWVLQCILNFFDPEELEDLIDSITRDCVSLCRHHHGTNVVQRVLERGTADQRLQVVYALAPHVAELSHSPAACKTLAAAVCRDDEAASDCVRALLDSPGALTAMAHSRTGHLTVVALLQATSGERLRAAVNQLLAQRASLNGSKHGRRVLKLLPDGGWGQ